MQGDKRPVVMGADKAAPGGVATLDASGNVPFEQLGNVVRPNLLINPDFLNPVNQRGQTEYTEAGYTIDRWKTPTGGTISIEADGIHIKQGSSPYGYVILEQAIENGTMLKERQLTLSVLTSEGLVWKSGTIGNLRSVYATDTSYVTCITSGSNTVVQFVSKTDNAPALIAIKLELGSTQTLAHQDTDGNWVLNEIPDYGEELRKCQRYFYKFDKYLLPAMSFGNTAWWFKLDFPVPMRATPEIVGLDTGKLMTGGTNLSGATFELGNRNAEQVNVTCKYSTFDSAAKYVVSYGSGYAYASADL